MKSITVLTPTFNRSATLPRVYDSLVAQTDHDFLWLIVDDGSTDSTESIVREWMNESRIEIEYYKIPKGGQHKALQFGYNKAETKYLVKVDSDDALTQDAIQIYKRVWDSVDNTDNDRKIGNIASLSMSENKEIVGKWVFPADAAQIDSDWFEMVLKLNNHNDLSSCTMTSVLKEIYPADYSFWHEDKTNIIDGVFFPRISRKYKTRYINKALQIIYFDAPFSSLRSMNSYENKFWKVVVDNKYFLDENIDYFFWQPGYYIRMILKLTVSSIICKVGLKELFSKIESNFLKFLIILFYPGSIALYVYYKFIRGQFWI
jgi:glycosyltransferase involved in cell wall biosynthesis